MSPFNPLRSLTHRHTRHSFDEIPLHSYLYQIRPYSNLSTVANVNGFYLRRLLKSNYSCRFERSDSNFMAKLQTNKSTFILGRYLITLHMHNLQLYSISHRRLSFINEDRCEKKIVFIGVCTYNDLHRHIPFGQDGFILMTSDQRLLLYDFKLKSRLTDRQGISFACELSLKSYEKAFEYHEQTHMISIHARRPPHSHVFILFRLWPRWLSYVMLIERDIFGTDMKQVSITSEFLIVQNQRNTCQLYSLHHLLSQYTIKSHSIADHPNTLLPVNVQIDSCPPCLYVFTSDRPLFDYALISSEHFLKRINEDYLVVHLNQESTAVPNGHFKRSWMDNASPNGQVYFLNSSLSHDFIFDVRESIGNVWILTYENSQSYVKHLYTIDDGSNLHRNSNENQHVVTRYGRETHSQQVIDLSDNTLTDHYFDLFHNFLTVLFESDSSRNVLIRVVEHPTGLIRQEIQFEKFSHQNQLKLHHEHDQLIVQELSCATVFLHIFTLKRSNCKAE